MPKKLFVYSIVGSINTVTDYLIFLFFTAGIGYDPVLSNIISYSLGTGISFLLNRHFTFRMTRYIFNIRDQLARFCAVSLLSLAISTGFLYLFSRWMAPPMAKILTVPFVLTWGFLAVRAFVFTASAPRDHTNSAISF
jgi:putative flippase GtrA